MEVHDVVKQSPPVLLLLLVGFVSNASVLAQERPAPPPPTMPGMTIGPPAVGEWYRPPALENRRPPQRRSVLEFAPDSKERRLLAVAHEDLQTYAAFLRAPDTGAFRLLPFFPRRKVVSANSPDIGWRAGFSAYASEYSFAKKKHGHGVNGWGTASFGWAELRLRSGLFRTGVMDQSLGLLIKLGDVPLEEVTTSTPGVGELIQLVPPANEAAKVELYRKLFTGYRVHGFRYASGMVAQVNTTYVLRSILNKRVDHLVAFRVVRLSEAEGVTIVWKRLAEYPKPRWQAKARK